MHIGIVFWGLYSSRGGLQKFSADLIHAMIARGHKMTVFYKYKKRAADVPSYTLPPEVTLHNLHLDDYNKVEESAKKSVIENARTIIAASGVDVLVAPFSWHELMFFPALLQDSGIPLLISEHSSPEIINTERWNPLEHNACLHAADSIHILSEPFLDSYPAFLHSRITVIPNAVSIEGARASKIPSRNGQKNLLAAGRFIDDVKQYSLLLRAFALLAGSFPDWRLTLCGDGADRSLYDTLIAELDLKNKVSLPGMVRDMSRYYADSDVFCMPSRYEGFPLAPLEAQHFELPVVGFADCSGLNQIVLHGENGLLSRQMDAEGLAEQLAKLMGDEDLRITMGKRGKELLSRYDPAEIYDKWEALLQKTARVKGKTRLSGFRPIIAEEQRCNHMLSEILLRETPFARPDDSYSRNLAERRRFLENWRRKLRDRWYYRAWLKLSGLWR